MFIVYIYIPLLLLSNGTGLCNLGISPLLASAKKMAAPTPINKTEEEWKVILSPEQFRILRQKGTE